MAGGCWGATGLLYRLSNGCRQAPCCCWLGCWELCRLTQPCRMVGQQRPACLGRHQQRGNTIITPNSLNLCTGPPRSRANAEGGLPGEPNHASVHGGPAGSAAAAAAAAAAGCDCGKVRVDFYGESLCPDCQVGRPTCWSGKAGRQISQQARAEVEQQVALPRLLRAPGPELSERAGLCGGSLLCCNLSLPRGHCHALWLAVQQPSPRCAACQCPLLQHMVRDVLAPMFSNGIADLIDLR